MFFFAPLPRSSEEQKPKGITKKSGKKNKIKQTNFNFLSFKFFSFLFTFKK
jgi:hypothetical protein